MNSLVSHFPNLTATQIKQFNALEALYLDWNQKINVISRKDTSNFYTHHLLHSLALAKVVQFKPNETILDVGTGGGFPGIPLAILFPESTFTLIDSIGKKIMVVQEVAASLHLKNVIALKGRAEEVPNKFNYLVTRAVAPTPTLVHWVKGKIEATSKKSGLYCLKGGDLSQELIDFPMATSYNIQDFFCDDFFETKKVVFLPYKYIL